MLELTHFEKTMIFARKFGVWRKSESKAKRVYLAIALRTFGAAFEAVTSLCRECDSELAPWEEGRRFALGVEPSGPYITLEKKGGKIRMIGTGLKDPVLSIVFKNLDSAMMVYTTYMGVVQATAENRAVIRGDNGKAMEVIRILDIVMIYLLPGFILKKNFRTAPTLSVTQYLVKLRVYASLIPFIVKTLF
ncbi:MAG: hypothetical protein ACP5IL_11995 [Syntrophobacteraceae bacterium]